LKSKLVLKDKLAFFGVVKDEEERFDPEENSSSPLTE
jgi:hypothetical protein